MARLLSSGFETGVVADEFDSVSYLAISNTYYRTGGYSARVSGGWGIINIPDTSVQEHYIGFGYYLSTNSTTTWSLLSALGETHLQLVVNASTGYITATCNSNTILSSKGAPFDNWNYVEIHFKLNASGAIDVKINGDTVISWTGNTLHIGYDTTIAAIKWLAPSSNTCWIDDFVDNNTATAYNNTWPGRVKLYPIRPSAPGDVTDLSRGGVDSGANWSQVDEVPASATDWVWSDVADKYDLYNFTTVTLPTGYAITNLIVVNDVNLDSGTGKITSKIKSDGTEAQGTDHTLSNTTHAYSDAFPVNPNTSAAWDQTDIDDIQAGPMTRA